MPAMLVTDLPPELLRIVIKKLPLADQLNLRSASRGLNAFVVSEIKPATCQLVHLSVEQVQSDTVVVVAVLQNRESALHLAALDELHADVEKPWKESLEDHPVHLTAESLSWFKTLLAGCTIDRATIVVDHRTQIEEIPSLLAQLQTRSVEFVLRDVVQRDMFRLFRHSHFFARLAATAVKEITFVADDTYFDRKLANGYAPGDCAYFEVLEQVLSNGITHIRLRVALGLESEIEESLLPFLRTISLAAYDVDILIKASLFSIKEGEKVYRIGNEYPRYRVTVYKFQQRHYSDEFRIQTLKEDEEADLAPIAL
ncbi:hypothetical protein PRIPAC_80416 [Pristionchus pacificus]|uniref:F-box domain-containing protein n=1 Tax=Pristionchus pacificus TaxID=54126 RepID=A0A2A6CKD6_PRIPA|nr:hypothetical protein PRIPAC_80416 [Pristionchus pacificus]|eukprot:PDM78548.1 F-box domain-containing protein [Pristionchus pacificus]